MGKYIKHKEYENLREIRITVCIGESASWQPNVPLQMLKEFSYLGFQDWCAGGFVDIKETTFLDTLISDYDNIEKIWSNDRGFLELICNDIDAQNFINDKMNNYEFDIIMIPYNGSVSFVVSDFYIYDIKKQLSKYNIDITIKDYQYKSIEKIGTYDFSNRRDNGVQEFYHIEGLSNDSIDIIHNKTDDSGLWFGIYHNPQGGEEVINSCSSKSIYEAKKLACDWYNNR